MSLATFSTAYLPPIQYFSKLKNFNEVTIEHHEHFQKQTYRSRCHIYGANGMLKLSIPVTHSGERTIIKDVKISNTHDWQKIHWKSIESAYRCSPYFEFYESEFAPFYQEKKTEFLIDFNNEILDLLLRLLKLKITIKPTSEYTQEITTGADFRNNITPKIPAEQDKQFISQPYIQVFGSKHGFIHNLSIIDLLCNEGPNSPFFL